MAGQVAQLSVQVFIDPINGSVRSSQVSIQAWTHVILPPVRVSQTTIQALTQVQNRPVLACQLCVLVLIANLERTVAIYPQLPGLAYSVHKKPMFSTGTGKGASGKDVRIAYWSVNKWEWTLTYEYLPDKQANGLTASDFKTLMDFFIVAAGGFQAFGFLDPDDNTVTNQGIAISDGVTLSYTLGRNWNNDSSAPYEPVGLINLSQPFSVKVNGSVVSPSTYTVITTTPVNQVLRFNTAPASGAVITASFSWYFWVTFKDDNLDFENFMHQLWSLKEVSLISQRQ